MKLETFYLLIHRVENPLLGNIANDFSSSAASIAPLTLAGENLLAQLQLDFCVSYNPTVCGLQQMDVPI